MMISRTKIIEILRKKIDPKFWSSFWLYVPAIALFILPVGLLSTYILGLLGFQGVGRLVQIIIIFSIIYGFLNGTTVLFLANDLGFSPNHTSRIKWLARFAVVTPLLSILILFLVFSR